MAAFAEQNGNVRAVSNISMNARGDVIDAKGNVKIPSQTISRATSVIKSNERQSVSLKADENIAPVKDAPVVEDLTPPSKPAVKKPVPAPVVEEVTIVSQDEIDTPDGPAIEVTYSDGSMEVILKDKDESN
jgi:hypothetical protein